MSFQDYEHLLQGKPTEVERLTMFVNSLPDDQKKLAFAYLSKLSAEKNVALFKTEGYIVSVRTVREWKRLNHGV